MLILYAINRVRNNNVRRFAALPVNHFSSKQLYMEIEKLTKYIDDVNVEIIEVGKEIKVEDQKSPLNNDKLLDLRKEEEQLRKEEEQLRKEKDQLRKKEEQLRNEKEFLREESKLLI